MKKIILNVLFIACVNFVFSQGEQTFTRVNLNNTSAGAIILNTGTGTSRQVIRLSNDDINGVNKLTINDLGLSEGIIWENGNIDISVDDNATYGFNAFVFRTRGNLPFLFKNRTSTATLNLSGTPTANSGGINGGALINFNTRYSIGYTNNPVAAGEYLQLIDKANNKGILMNQSRIIVNKKMILSNQSVSSAPNPNGFLLAVDGKAIAEEMWVQNSTTWPDYVFTDTYELKTLTEVETFINKNSHLPEVPSAKEIDENGINTGEMQAVLLKKIEELTLYVIENKKAIDSLQKENTMLKKQLLAK